MHEDHVGLMLKRVDVDPEMELFAALHAEATRLGIDWSRATDADIVKIARVLPEDLKLDIAAAAERNACAAEEFTVVFLRPLFLRPPLGAT